MHTYVMYTYNIQQFFLCLHVRCLKFHVCMRMQHMCKHLCIHMQHAYVYTRNTCVNIFCLHVRFHTCGTSKQLTCKQEKSCHTWKSYVMYDCHVMYDCMTLRHVWLTCRSLLQKSPIKAATFYDCHVSHTVIHDQSHIWFSRVTYGHFVSRVMPHMFTCVDVRCFTHATHVYLCGRQIFTCFTHVVQVNIWRVNRKNCILIIHNRKMIISIHNICMHTVCNFFNCLHVRCLHMWYICIHVKCLHMCWV